jgi:hypothetical protein
MKSRAWCFVVVQLLATSAAQAQWGIGGTVGYWRPDVSTFQTDMDDRNERPLGGTLPGSGHISDSAFNWGAECFGELPMGSIFSVGLSAGYEKPSTTEYHYASEFVGFPSIDSSNRSYIIPLSLYGKVRPKDLPVSFILGAGADGIFLNSPFHETNATGQLIYDTTLSDSRWVPHLLVGAEYFIRPWVSLGFNMRYLFNATLNNLHSSSGDQERLIPIGGADYLFLQDAASSLGRPATFDYGGPRFASTLRFYF